MENNGKQNPKAGVKSPPSRGGSSSGSDVSIIKISPTIFIISFLADKVIRAADSLISLNFDSYLAPANQAVPLTV